MATIEAHNLTVTAKGTLPGVPFLKLKEAVLGKEYDLSIIFLPPKEARALNIAHRGKDYVPNTLSFSLTKKSGEIVLCASTIRKEHRSFGKTYEAYLSFLIIHSALHLKGYVHGSTMERREKYFVRLLAQK